jgi:hypothetical protein
VPLAGLLSLVVGIGLPVALLVGMFATAFSGRAPAQVTVGDGVVHVRMVGLMPVFAVRRRLDVALADIVTVHADRFVRNLLGGFRMGTHFPRVMTAGTFFRGGGRRDFFAICRRGEALVLDLRPGARFWRRVIVEVDDLDATAAAIDAAVRP